MSLSPQASALPGRVLILGLGWSGRVLAAQLQAQAADAQAPLLRGQTACLPLRAGTWNASRKSAAFPCI